MEHFYWLWICNTSHIERWFDRTYGIPNSYVPSFQSWYKHQIWEQSIWVKCESIQKFSNSIIVCVRWLKIRKLELHFVLYKKDPASFCNPFALLHQKWTAGNLQFMPFLLFHIFFCCANCYLSNTPNRTNPTLHTRHFFSLWYWSANIW